MRILKRHIERNGAGRVVLFPEDSEDMWTAYNLVRSGDTVSATARRKVKMQSETGSMVEKRVAATFTIRVKDTFFDTQAATLRVSGRIVKENQWAEMGSHQSLTLELNQQFSLEKAEGWDSISLQTLEEACDVRKGASAWAVVMQEGIANIAVLMGERTVLRLRISEPVPGKKGGEKAHAKAMQSFFETTMNSLLRQLDLNESLPILLASPSTVAANFKDFIFDHATRNADKALLAQRNNFLVVHSSSGQLHALSEVLASPEVRSRLANTRYARESKLMDDFHAMLRNDDGRAVYGLKEVRNAVDAGAVGRGGGVLLISNALFRNDDLEERKKWVRLHDRVKEQEGGEVRVLSSEHDSGKRLQGLGGLAAITTYALPEEDDGDEEGEEGGIGVNGS